MKALDKENPSEFSDFESSLPADPEDRGPAIASTAQAGLETVDRDPTAAALRLIWENRRFMGRVVTVSLVLSVAVAFLIPTRYGSTARLMPPDSQGSSGLAMAAAAISGGGGAGGLGGMASELLGLKSTSDLLVSVIDSRTVKDKLVQKFDLKSVYGERRMSDVRKNLEKRTEVSVDRKSQVITITVTDRSPSRARAMAEAYVEELNRTLADVSTSSARRERIFLEGRLTEVGRDLERAEKDFSQFESKSSTIDIKEQSRAMVDAAATLQGELIAARSELKGLRPIYTQNNIRVRSVQARINELENQLQKIGGKGQGMSVEAADSNESLYPSIKKLPLLGMTYADLYRKTKIEEAVLETLTQQYELAKVQEAKEIPTVKVLDPPELPDKKSFPSRTLIVLLGATLAFSGGVTWVFGREAWNGTPGTNPRKLLAQEVFAAMQASLPWSSQNGTAGKARGLASRVRTVKLKRTSKSNNDRI